MNTACHRAGVAETALLSEAGRALKVRDYKLYWLALGKMVGTTDAMLETIRNTHIPFELRSTMVLAFPFIDQAHGDVVKFVNDAGAGDGASALKDVKEMVAAGKNAEPFFAAAGLNVCANS